MRIFSKSVTEQTRIIYAILKRINRYDNSRTSASVMAEQMLSDYITDEDNNLLDPYTTRRICYEVDALNMIAFRALCIKAWILIKLFH